MMTNLLYYCHNKFPSKAYGEMFTAVTNCWILVIKKTHSILGHLYTIFLFKIYYYFVINNTTPNHPSDLISGKIINVYKSTDFGQKS